MRTLYLLRHAKSSWKEESQLDFERPLAGPRQKGLRPHCQTHSVRGDRVRFASEFVCGKSARDIELVRQQAKLRSELRFDERIYEAPVTRLVEIISEVENDRKVILLVGHNPGMEELIHALTGEEQGMPTAGLAKIKLKSSKWAEVGEAKGTLEWIVRPKELEETEDH